MKLYNSNGLLGRLFSAQLLCALAIGTSLFVSGSSTWGHAGHAGHGHGEMLRPAFQGAAQNIGGGTSNITAGFNIVFNFINTPTPAQAAVFAAAESVWEGIITGYQETVFNNIVTIDVNLGNIDGPGGILGSAGPTTAKVATNFIYSNSGVMNFDTSDIPGLGAAFNDVVLHEMGHVIGIGTLWSSSDVGLPGFQELYVNNSGQYTGAAGLAAYNSEFGQAGAFVPIELGGGPGTANAHWNEVDGGAGPTGIVSNIQPGPNNDFAFELMTGWLNPGSFISSLTTESLVDIGYNVVPEPTGLVLGCFGIASLVVRRRRA